MFKLVALLVAALSCLATLVLAQSIPAAVAGAGTSTAAAVTSPAKDTKGRTATAVIPAGTAPAVTKKTFNESRLNAAPETAVKKTFNESRSNALRTGESPAPAGK